MPAPAIASASQARLWLFYHAGLFGPLYVTEAYDHRIESVNRQKSTHEAGELCKCRPRGRSEALPDEVIIELSRGHRIFGTEQCEEG